MNKLDRILDEYHKYLMQRRLVKELHAPYLVRWVREFLRFAKDKTGYKFETVDSPRKNLPGGRLAQKNSWKDVAKTCL